MSLHGEDHVAIAVRYSAMTAFGTMTAWANNIISRLVGVVHDFHFVQLYSDCRRRHW
jgi:hypothetical protein